MSVDMRSESKGALLDSLSTLGYSGRGSPLGLLAFRFEDICEIIWMVVCYWRTAHSLRADGTGGCA
jgi:hypothetical protein